MSSIPMEPTFDRAPRLKFVNYNMDFQLYLIVLLFPLALLQYHVHAEGVKSRCESPATYIGDTGSVTCYFSVDLKQSSKSFRLYRYSMDPTNIRTQDELVVLECYWLIVGDMQCESPAPGYEFNGTVSDQVRVTMPNVSPDFQGKYECRAEPSYPRDIKDCVFLIKISPEPTAGQTPDAESNEDSSKTAGIAVGVVAAILLTAIVLVVFQKRFKDRLSFCGRQSTKDRSPAEPTPGETGTPLLTSHAQERSPVTESPEGHNSIVTGESEDKKLDRQNRTNNEIDESVSRERRHGEDLEPAAVSVTSDSGYRILLVGKTGTGKSATGNTILGEEKFQVRQVKKFQDRRDFTRKTCQLERGKCLGRIVEIVDTPGLSQAPDFEEKAVKEIARLVEEMSLGFHVVLWLVRYDWIYTSADDYCYNHLKTLLGENVTKHMIVLLTGADGGTDQERRNYEELTKVVVTNISKIALVKPVMDDCEWRHVPFINSADEKTKAAQLEYLFSTIDKLLAENGREIFRPTLNVTEAIEVAADNKSKK